MRRVEEKDPGRCCWGDMNEASNWHEQEELGLRGGCWSSPRGQHSILSSHDPQEGGAAPEGSVRRGSQANKGDAAESKMDWRSAVDGWVSTPGHSLLDTAYWSPGSLGPGGDVLNTP